MLSPGDVVLASVRFVDKFGEKRRPAVVLFEEYGNVVAAAVTSNTAMKGIPLTVEEGAVKPSVIKPNYLVTISKDDISKKLFSLSKEKKRILFRELSARIAGLNV